MTNQLFTRFWCRSLNGVLSSRESPIQNSRTVRMCD